MNAKTILSMQLALLLCAVDAPATIYDYSVDGQFEVDNVTQYVSGNMQISDEFLVDGEVRYYFGITGFSLNVAGGTNSFDFSGDSGSLLYIHQITDPLTGQKYYEQQWGISNPSSEVWVNPFSTSIYFYTSDMTPYLPTSSEYYGVLAPIIGLDRPFYASQYSDPHAPGESPVGQIWLTRSDVPVIPEPSTMVLLGTGLIALFMVSARMKRS